MKPERPKKQQEKTQEHSEEPNMNYAEALRLLKETQERLDKKKKQIRVDSMKADRGKWHIEESQKKSQLHKVIKEENQRLRNQYSVLRAKQFQKIMQMKKEGERMRQQGLKKRSMSRLETLQNKIRMKQEVRETSLHHTEKMIMKRQQELQRKRQNRLSLYGSRKQSRLVVQEFQASRVISIKSSMSKERDELLKILKKKQKELEELDNVQTVTSRVKVQKQPSTTQNVRSIDQSMRIYNPSSSHKKQRKRSLSDYKFLKESGTLITEL